MLYDAYEVGRGWLATASTAAKIGSQWWENPSNPFAYSGMGPVVSAALNVFAHASAPRGKPAWGLPSTQIDGREVAVTEVIVDRKPFGQLRRFVREGRDGDPVVLVIAPMSGHFATLLRGTVERLLPGHDVYVTDWRDAKNVPLSDGSFDLDDYIDYLIQWTQAIGPHVNWLAVCQPAVPAYAALCLMSAHDDPATPATLTMMGGPIDTRQQPTAVNTLAERRPYAWFTQNAIATVPQMYPGAGRKVYPGFLQLAGFMSMNLGNHLNSHWEMFKHLVSHEDTEADQTKAFYEEYRSSADMTAEFYLQTVDVVFQRHLLPRGEMTHRGERVDPAAIRHTGLLAIEGERDDISGVGQTKSALTMAVNLPDADKQYLLAKGAGHYGIFNGSKWRDQIAPVVEQFIRAHVPGVDKHAPAAVLPEPDAQAGAADAVAHA